jgi:hypothetical protein
MIRRGAHVPRRTTYLAVPLAAAAVATAFGLAAPADPAAASPPTPIAFPAPVHPKRAGADPAAPARATVAPPIVCDPARPAATAFYGSAASAIYDAVFSRAFAAPGLSAGYTPQGMTEWRAPDGRSLIVIGEFRKGHNSRLVAVDPDTGRTYGTVEVAPAHLGGVAIVGDWLFAQDKPRDGGEQVRKYAMSTLSAAFAASAASGGRTMPFVARTGALQDVYYASFLSSFGGSLWAGHHGINETKMFEYRVGPDGTLRQVGGAYQVPKFTDGVVVSADRFIFVSHAPAGTSRGFGTMTVAVRSANLSDHPRRCFAMPNLGEGTTLVGGRVYTVFESGTPKAHPASANRIPYLHRADYRALAGLLRP